MRLYDTFLFGGSPADLDLLECRLYEYGDDSPVYMHVVVEGDITFTGRPKPLYYAENQDRFARWAHRIRYVPISPATGEPGKEPGEAWAREHASRQACRLGLTDAGPGDLVVHGDCDEILTREALDWLSAGIEAGPYKLSLRLFSFAADWLQPFAWRAPSIARYGDIGSFTVLRETGWPVLALPSGNAAGWHLSSLGGYEAIEIKARSFSHTEAAGMIIANARRFYECGEWTGGDPDGVHHDWYQMAAADVDETWPRWIYERRCPPSWFRPRHEGAVT